MTLTRRSTLAALGAAPALAATSGRAATASSGSPLRLWYRQPAKTWVEALPVGSGKLGAMVFGGVGAERLQLNEDTLWAGGPYEPINPEAGAALPEIRRLIDAGEYAKAAQLAEAKFVGVPKQQMSYQTIGDLKLEFPGLAEPTGYVRELDLDGAIATTRLTAGGVDYLREVIASAPDGVIAVRLSASRSGAISLDLSFASPLKSKPVASIEGRSLVLTGVNDSQQGIAARLKFECRVDVRAKGGRVSGQGETLSIRDADEVVLLIAAATSYRRYDDVSGDPTALNKATLAKVANKPWAKILADHQADHRALFHRVEVDFGRTRAELPPTDERIKASPTTDDPSLAALYYQYGRYLLIACSRPGGQAANLQGIWNDKPNAPWGSKYTININTEMNYWPAEPTNLPELVEPLIALVRDLSETGARTAKAMYGARGWVAHHNTDLWRATAPVDGAPWGVWPTGGAWLCKHLWDHYDYGRDRAYLARVYPLMKGSARFFLDTLVVDPKFGVWSPTRRCARERPWAWGLDRRWSDHGPGDHPRPVRQLPEGRGRAGRGRGLRRRAQGGPRQAGALQDRQGRPAAGVAGGLGRRRARHPPPSRLAPLWPVSIGPDRDRHDSEAGGGGQDDPCHARRSLDRLGDRLAVEPLGAAGRGRSRPWNLAPAARARADLSEHVRRPSAVPDRRQFRRDLGHDRDDPAEPQRSHLPAAGPAVGLAVGPHQGLASAGRGRCRRALGGRQAGRGGAHGQGRGPSRRGARRLQLDRGAS
nr:glycoside hydrolase family 95 protein [Caulobacter sp. CCH9-E1]